MEIEFSLGESDLLNFQMYSSGDSKPVKRRIFVARFLLTGIVLVAACFAFADGDYPSSIVLAGLALCCGIYFPRFLKWRYRNHFRAHVREKCSGMLEKAAKLRIEEDGLHSRGEDSEGKIQFSGIEALIELEALYLIRLKQSQTLIMPKSRVTGYDVDAFIQELSRIADLSILDHRGAPWAEPISQS